MSEWYCESAGQPAGPYTLEELHFLRDQGRIRPQDRLRQGVAGQWVAARSVVPFVARNGSGGIATGSLGGVVPRRRMEAAPVAEPVASEPTAPPSLPDLPPEPVDHTRRNRILTGAGIATILLLLLLLLFWLFNDPNQGGGGGPGGQLAGNGNGPGNGDGVGVATGAGAGDVAGDSAPAGPASSASVGDAMDSEATSSVEQSTTEPVEPEEISETDQPVTQPIEASVVALNSAPPQGNPPPPAAPGGGSDLGLGGGGGSGDGGGSGGGSGLGLGEKSGDASFFGVKGKGNKIVYIVDCSGSMGGAPFHRACTELMTSIQAFKSRQQFYVFFFNSGSFPMFAPQTVEREMLKATKTNKEKLLAWVSQSRCGGGTDPTQSLVQALSLDPAPDTIFLLTDGGFGTNALMAIRRLNPEKKTIINTIAFIHAAGAPLLQQIAQENGGTYSFVP